MPVGISTVLLKPFDPDALQEAIVRVLAASSGPDENGAAGDVARSDPCSLIPVPCSLI
jgi:hypothetical protein